MAVPSAKAVRASAPISAGRERRRLAGAWDMCVAARTPLGAPHILTALVELPRQVRGGT
jgi:hypothetical protein